MGAVKGHPLLKKLMDFYESDEVFNLKHYMAPAVFNAVLVKEKLLNRPEDRTSEFNTFEKYKNQETLELDNLKIYPMSYFSPNWEDFQENAILEHTHYTLEPKFLVVHT